MASPVDADASEMPPASVTFENPNLTIRVVADAERFPERQ